jgi:hypothetical protein
VAALIGALRLFLRATGETCTPPPIRPGRHALSPPGEIDVPLVFSWHLCLALHPALHGHANAVSHTYTIAHAHATQPSAATRCRALSYPPNADARSQPRAPVGGLWGRCYTSEQGYGRTPGEAGGVRRWRNRIGAGGPRPWGPLLRAGQWAGGGLRPARPHEEGAFGEQAGGHRRRGALGAGAEEGTGIIEQVLPRRSVFRARRRRPGSAAPPLGPTCRPSPSRSRSHGQSGPGAGVFSLANPSPNPLMLDVTWWPVRPPPSRGHGRQQGGPVEYEEE